MKQNIIPKRLFTASCFALITTAMTFAIRVKLEMVFNQDYLLTLEEIGYAFAPAFWGFTLAMMIGGFFVDLFGMKKGQLIMTIFKGKEDKTSMIISLRMAHFI